MNGITRFQQRIMPVTIFALMTAAASAQTPVLWEWQNPVPHGREIYDIVITESGVAIAACVDGYIMRSTDNGESWSTQRLLPQDVQDIDYVQGAGLWAMTVTGGVYFSSDLGVTWEEQLAPGTTAYHLRNYVEMYNASRGMALLEGHRLFATTDGGKQWDPRPSLPVPPNKWLRSPSSKTADIWYILDKRPDSTLMTTDFGQSWIREERPHHRGFLNFITWIDSTTGFQGYLNTLFRTSNGGLSWTECQIPKYLNLRMVVSPPSNSTDIYCLTSGETYVLASSDNGETWAPYLQAADLPTAYPGCMAFTDESLGVIGTTAGSILRTTDAGQTWSRMHGFGYTEYIFDVDFVNDMHGIAAGRYGWLLTTTDGGKNWDPMLAVDTCDFLHIAMYSNNSGYAVTRISPPTGGMAQLLFHTSDFGKTWEMRSNLKLRGDLNPVTSFEVHGPDRVLIGTTQGRVLISDDSGTTFRNIDVSPQFQDYNLYGHDLRQIPNGHLIYTAPDGIAHSTDDGGTWEVHMLIPPWRSIEQTQFFDAKHGVGILSSDIEGVRVFCTTSDGGATWSPGPVGNIRLMHFFDSRNGAALLNKTGTDSSQTFMATTNDGGKSWDILPLQERVKPADWYWHSPTDCWAFGYNGMIRHLDAKGIVGIADPAHIPGSIHIGAVHPNPVSLSGHNSASMRLTLPAGQPQQITVSVYDMLGRKTQIAYSGFMDAGAHIVSVPIRVFKSPGLYTVAVSAREKRVTRKIVVME